MNRRHAIAGSQFCRFCETPLDSMDESECCPEARLTARVVMLREKLRKARVEIKRLRQMWNNAHGGPDAR
jgi:hypothetical protein